jgi:hypothetical protein
VKKSVILAALAAATLSAGPAPVSAEQGRTVAAGDHYFVRRGGAGDSSCVEYDGVLLIDRSGGTIRVRCGRVKPDCFKDNDPAASSTETIWLGCKEHVRFVPAAGVKLKAVKEAGAVHVYSKGGR